MDSTFLTDDFLFQTSYAVELYHGYARDLPIIDYHCHLPPKEIAEDHRFENLTQIWLYGDHYKWRAMRTAGVEERYCTGDATDWEKFSRWAETVPQTLCNPLYHWTHMELKRPFGISDRLLNPKTAEGIWRECNVKLAMPEFSARGIMRQMNVALVCTTDDPTDTLEYHQALAADPTFPIQVLPTFRPDKALAIDSPEAFNRWTDRLAAVTDIDIGDRLDRFFDALWQRHVFFHEMGCRLSDHGIENFSAEDYTAEKVSSALCRLRRGEALGSDDARKLRSAVLHELAVMNAKTGWVQQFHFGAIRNANTRMFEVLGPDCGFDSIGDPMVARPIAKFLDRLDRDGQLAKTILYNINPAHNEVVATMLGNFHDASTPGKIQFGSGWWFLDQKDGMERQMRALSTLGLLSRFVGMVTDSRSFLSYTRHEYFRRILCNLLGTEIAEGLLPNDLELVGSMVRDICYENPVRYFGFARR